MNEPKIEDMSEWEIKTTSNHCPYVRIIYNFRKDEKDDRCYMECTYPDNEGMVCSSKTCPIKIK